MFNKKSIMYLNKIIMLSLFVVFLEACTFVPEISEKQKYSSSCHMLTKHLKLSAREIKGNLCDSGDSADACIMTFGVIVPLGSFLISGSVVLVGNTLHWLEAQGPCSRAILNNNHTSSTAVKKHNNAFKRDAEKAPRPLT
jgi:hypothetical protein